MSSLIRKDCYLQGLARRICARESHAGGRIRPDGPPAKKKKRRRGGPPFKGAEGGPHGQKVAPAARKPSSAGKRQPAMKKDRRVVPGSAPIQAKENSQPGAPEAPGSSFSAMGLLRQRLREKIQAASGQGRSTELSPAVLEKRQRRKYERERKKRRRKELRTKAKAAKEENEEEEVKEDGKCAAATAAPIVFNKVTVREEGGALSQAEKRREKRKAAKGGLSPLTGKNYRQLLQRLEARKGRVEALKESAGAGEAQALEARMRWSSALHRAEGLRVRDDAGRLQAALKAKRQREARRQRKWGQRTEQAAQRMQQRQEKRRRNLQRRKQGKAEQRKAKARRKGRVLPGDLEKAGLR